MAASLSINDEVEAAEAVVYTALHALIEAERSRIRLATSLNDGSIDPACDAAITAAMREVQERRWALDEAMARQVSGKPYALTASPNLVATLMRDRLSHNRSVRRIEAHAAASAAPFARRLPRDADFVSPAGA